ncbi:MAG: subtilase family N-terminal domain-containing protein [Alistipes onderdonkii]
MTDATDGGSQIPATSHKIVNTSIDAEAGSLLVYFDDAAIGSLEQAAEAAAKTRSVATRAGIVSVDEILSELNVSSLNRLFPVDTRNEERTRAAGLHRWYELQFDTEVDLDLAAQKLSAVAESGEHPVQHEARKNVGRQGHPAPFGCARHVGRHTFDRMAVQRPGIEAPVALYQQRRQGRGTDRARRCGHQRGRGMETHGRRSQDHRSRSRRRREIYAPRPGCEHVGQHQGDDRNHGRR